MSLQSEKAALRQVIRTTLAAQPDPVRQAGDRRLFQQLLAQPEFQRAESLLLFLGVGTEPDTAPLIRALLRDGRRVALPRVLSRETMELRWITDLRQLRPGRLRIPEPDASCPLAAPEALEFALIPALCYDKSRYRLGQGGGYYDRFLSAYTGFSAGLCRDAVLRDTLPREPHDRPVRLVLTETCVIEM